LKRWGGKKRKGNEVGEGKEEEEKMEKGEGGVEKRKVMRVRGRGRVVGGGVGRERKGIRGNGWGKGEGRWGVRGVKLAGQDRGKTKWGEVQSNGYKGKRWLRRTRGEGMRGKLRVRGE